MPVSLVANPTPLTVTVEPTGPLMRLMLRPGVTVNVVLFDTPDALPVAEML